MSESTAPFDAAHPAPAHAAVPVPPESVPAPPPILYDSALEAMPVGELVQALHAGDIPPDRLPAQVRQSCIGELTLDGFTNAEIAGLMRISERTIRRDRAALRRDEAVRPSLELGDELLGRYERLTEATVSRMARLARDPASPAFARLWAEEAITRVYQRFIQTTQKLGYLETGAARISHLKEIDPVRSRWFHEEGDAFRRRLDRNVYERERAAAGRQTV